MRHGLRHSAKVKTSGTLKVDPKIVLGSQLLQLSGVELDQAIESELLENPALERLDEFEDPLEIEDILESLAPDQLKGPDTDREGVRTTPNDAKESDWLDYAPGDESLWDNLMAQLTVRLRTDQIPLATYFVGSINERGYLQCTVEDAALDCRASLEEAEAVWKAIRLCEPAGVGAHDLRDCLILQLRDATSDLDRLARVILRRNWDELVARDRRAICRTYGISEEIADQVFEVILGLNPFPGESFAPRLGRRHRSVSAMPDVVISMEESGFLIEIPGPSPISLRVNPIYEKRRRELVRGRRGNAAERRHVEEYVDRAHRFLDALGQRRVQLARIGKYLVESQAGFVRTGEFRFLTPLTRSQVARDLGVHESTVSRATAGKFVQIVNGDVISFEVFFKPALRVQKMIEEILLTENPASPLSDERIAKILAEKGVPVARRTVNKYRDRTKLLSSRLRRTG